MGLRGPKPSGKTHRCMSKMEHSERIRREYVDPRRYEEGRKPCVRCGIYTFNGKQICTRCLNSLFPLRREIEKKGSKDASVTDKDG